MFNHFVLNTELKFSYQYLPTVRTVAWSTEWSIFSHWSDLRRSVGQGWNCLATAGGLAWPAAAESDEPRRRPGSIEGDQISFVTHAQALGRCVGGATEGKASAFVVTGFNFIPIFSFLYFYHQSSQIWPRTFKTNLLHIYQIFLEEEEELESELVKFVCKQPRFFFPELTKQQLIRDAGLCGFRFQGCFGSPHLCCSGVCWGWGPTTATRRRTGTRTSSEKLSISGAQHLPLPQVRPSAVIGRSQQLCCDWSDLKIPHRDQLGFGSNPQTDPETCPSAWWETGPWTTCASWSRAQTGTKLVPVQRLLNAGSRPRWRIHEPLEKAAPAGEMKEDLSIKERNQFYFRWPRNIQ